MAISDSSVVVRPFESEFECEFNDEFDLQGE